MKKIILRENCFGPDVEIDGESLFIHEYDNRDPKVVETIQDELILKLQELKSGMGMDDWTVISEINLHTHPFFLFFFLLIQNQCRYHHIHQ